MSDPSYREPDKDATIAALRKRVGELEGKGMPTLPEFVSRFWRTALLMCVGMAATVTALFCMHQCTAEHQAQMSEANARNAALCERACPGEVVDMSGHWDDLACLCATPGGEDPSGLTVVRPWEDR